jgi:membrane glycosyltransferase
MADRMSIWQEFFLFLKENKLYWLAPIIIVLLLLVAVVVIGSTAAGPFIYTLF